MTGLGRAPVLVALALIESTLSINYIISIYLDDPSTCVGVHYVTGLGRVPVLVAVAL